MATELRERTRRAVRDEVSAQAWQLFARQGFAGTTVDEIAAAAGMSRRSFFRYFASKENLLLEGLLENAQLVADELAVRPADEPVWSALRQAFQPLADAMEEHHEYTRPLTVMLREPGLRATVQERRVRLQAMLAPLVAERLPAEDHRATRAAAIAGAAFGCLESAQQIWADRPGTSMTELLDVTFGALGTR